MRTILVVIRGVGLNNVIQLSEAETEEMVQAFTLKAADPGFDETIYLRCRLHPMRTVRLERSVSSIPSILAVVGPCRW